MKQILRPILRPIHAVGPAGVDQFNMHSTSRSEKKQKHFRAQYSDLE